jgi:hypothetical protein
LAPVGIAHDEFRGAVGLAAENLDRLVLKQDPDRMASVMLIICFGKA